MDLSNNSLKNKCGFHLARIISNHGEVKDETVWAYALRNETPSANELVTGLEELYLANNNITDKAIFKLIKALYNDIYLKMIDFRRNDIGL